MRYHFITFGNEPWHASVNQLCAEARELGVFDVVICSFLSTIIGGYVVLIECYDIAKRLDLRFVCICRCVINQKKVINSESTIMS